VSAIGNEHCVYCGDYFQCRDHVIPVSYASVYRTYRPGDTVHCCTQCNTLLSNVAHFTVQDRAAYLMERYRQRFWKFIIFPPWRGADVLELGYKLRLQVEKSLKLKALYLTKLRNLELVSEGHSIEPIDPLVVRGKQLVPVLSYLDTLSAIKVVEVRDDELRKTLRAAIANNIPRGILYRTYRHVEGNEAVVFNLSEFRRRYKLKLSFEKEEGNLWKLHHVERTTMTDKEAVLEIAVQMIKAGKALC